MNYNYVNIKFKKKMARYPPFAEATRLLQTRYPPFADAILLLQTLSA